MGKAEQDRTEQINREPGKKVEQRGAGEQRQFLKTGTGGEPPHYVYTHSHTAHLVTANGESPSEFCRLTVAAYIPDAV